NFSTTAPLFELRLLSRVNVVDNSKIGRTAAATGRPVKIIHVYNKTGVAKLGDKVLVAIEREKRKGYIVGCKQKQNPMVPKFDANNIVLIDDGGLPLGTRIKVPVPSALRKRATPEFLKVLSLAPRFI
ncbi:hypothetical protein FSP39_001533, partial [Pinctada imbricata]